MLNYEVVDNKKNDWVVFVHGIGGSTKTWKRQREMFSEYYNLLLLDLPGHGENAENVVKRIDCKRLSKGIADTLNHLKIKAAHFIGMSMGTFVVANFATQYPNRVKKIVFGGAVLDIKGIYRFLMRITNSIKYILPQKFMCKFFAWFLMPRKNHKISRNIFLREAMKLDKKTMRAWIAYLQGALHSDDLINSLDRIKKKILFVTGDEDHCFINGCKAIAAKLKAKSKVIDHCGHVCTIERAAEFNEYALDYLAA